MTPLIPQAAGRTPSSLPIVALVLSVLGFCLPPLLLVGIVLGIIALVQAKGSQTPAILAVVLPVLAIPIIGILAAIAIPNFIKFQARSKQSEVKANLRAAFLSQQAFFAEGNGFSLHPETVGFSPERGNRYLYAFSVLGPIEANTGVPSKEAVGVGIDTQRHPTVSNAEALAAIPQPLAGTIGIQGQCPDDCAFTIVGAGNIDNDPTFDVWSISSANRPQAPAGTPYNDVSDLTD